MFCWGIVRAREYNFRFVVPLLLHHILFEFYRCCAFRCIGRLKWEWKSCCNRQICWKEMQWLSPYFVTDSLLILSSSSSYFIYYGSIQLPAAAAKDILLHTYINNNEIYEQPKYIDECKEQSIHGAIYDT